jgi:TolA-binding protein
MNWRSLAVCTFAVCLALSATTVDARKVKEKETIKSLENKRIEVRPGNAIVNSSDLARDNYRQFLDLVSDDPELSAEAMRRLADLELEASEADELAENMEEIGSSNYDNAVDLYQQLLQSYPDYDRNDTVLYQLARGYETGGKTDEALAVLNDLVRRYPDTPIIDEVQFRRGEMLFLRKDYNDAEIAYSAVVDYGSDSRFYEQSLYKLGWAQFKLAWHEDSLTPFFELLDLKIGDVEFDDNAEKFESLSRPEQEMVEDTFRVLSISFSYMDGAKSIDDFMNQHGHRDYAYIVYMNLGDLYLSKERYVDAAETYQAFVAQDPFHAKAPLLQVEVIEAYKQGGFPSLVLDGKKGFVERYAMDGEFWRRNLPEENTAVAAHLKANLTDLAQYYHAEAQANGKQADYQEAARWYRRYLASFPDDPDSAATNFLLAEILFESKDFTEATEEYERTAYAYPMHERSAEAGFAALLAYREQENLLQGEAKLAWHRAYLDSGLRFAETYPAHPESGAVLTAVAEDLFKQDQFDLAIAVAQTVVGKQPPVEPALARTAWTVIAHSQFDTENFVAAEQAYYQLRVFTPPGDLTADKEIKDRIASSIYKQGEQARDMGDLQAAVGHFTRLGQAVPDSPIRATAEYDAAAALITLAEWERAAGVLEQFRQDYPDSELADDVSQKLAVTYLESGQGREAALEFERIAVADASSDDIRREALWKASELYKKDGALADEQRVLRDIVARYPNPLAESIEAQYRLLEIATDMGDQNGRMALLKDLVYADATAGSERTDRTRYLAATASIELAAPVR